MSGAHIRIRKAGPDDADVFLELVEALADYEKRGARRMSDWYTYRLDRERLDRIAREPA